MRIVLENRSNKVKKQEENLEGLPSYLYFSEIITKGSFTCHKLRGKIKTNEQKQPIFHVAFFPEHRYMHTFLGHLYLCIEKFTE